MKLPSNERKRAVFSRRIIKKEVKNLPTLSFNFSIMIFISCIIEMKLML